MQKYYLLKKINEIEPVPLSLDDNPANVVEIC